MIERLVRMVLWSGSDAGQRFRFSEPLTIRMFEASIAVFLPSFSTLIFPALRIFPSPAPTPLCFLEQELDAFRMLLDDLSSKKFAN